MGEICSVSITYRIMPKELIKAHRQYLWIRKIMQWLIGIYAFSSALMLLAIPIWLFAETIGILVFAFGALFLSITIIRIIKVFWSQNRRIKREAPAFSQELSITFYEDKTNWKVGNVDSIIGWNHFKEIWENDDYFYFVVAMPDVYHVVPKSAFTSLDEVQTFREMAAANYLYIKS
ncbi:MAG: YcxB family protein [Defluviitaleaceae bacterium]|nr:YcxB family protein [Defluviitaleaceae bacterium]